MLVGITISKKIACDRQVDSKPISTFFVLLKILKMDFFDILVAFLGAKGMKKSMLVGSG